MNYTYQIIYSAGLKPDLTQVNQLALEGWELFWMGQSSSDQMTGQWGYVLRKKLSPAPQPAPQPTNIEEEVLAATTTRPEV